MVVVALLPVIKSFITKIAENKDVLLCDISYVWSGVARLEVMEGQTRLTCIPRKTLDNVNDHTKG